MQPSRGEARIAERLHDILTEAVKKKQKKLGLQGNQYLRIFAPGICSEQTYGISSQALRGSKR